MEASPPGNSPANTGWQEEFAHCLAELSALGIADAQECGRLREKLTAGVFTLVAVGQFKRGKSSLINAMLGQNLLPVGVVPLTSIVTVLRYGDEPAAYVHFESGETRTVPVNAIAEYVTEKQNPANVKSVRKVFVDYPSAWLRGGIRIVDTPGISSVFQHNSDVTYAYLPQADAVLFVASVDQPLNRQELDFIAKIRHHASKLFCILNKSDYLDEVELEESVEFSVRTLCDALGETVPIHAVSAKLALAGKLADDPEALERSGLHELEQMLRGFLDHEKAAVWQHSLARGLRRTLADASLKLELELKSLSLPVERSQAVLRYLEKKRSEIDAQWQEYEVLLDHDVERLYFDHAAPAIEQFKQDLKGKLPQEMEEWYRGLKTGRSRQLEQELESRLVARIRSAYDDWRRTRDREWMLSFEAIGRKYWARVQANVDEALQHASELLSLSHQSVDPELLWQAESGFSYKFWDEPPSLLLLQSLAVRALPRFLRDPLILIRARQRALELVETQAGRVRHDADARLRESLENFKSLIRARVQTTLGEIEAAIRKGAAANRENQPAMDKRRAVLAELQQRLEHLRTRVQNTSQTSAGPPVARTS